MRGNPAALQDEVGNIGPIPAYAGQPAANSPVFRVGGAYPRVCGATGIKKEDVKGEWGLSPRMRGNRLQGLCA